MSSPVETTASQPGRQVTTDKPSLPQFTYEPLTEKLSMRLLDFLPAQEDGIIRCRLRHESLARQRFKFSAVSYTWGDHLPTRFIIVNGCEMTIRQNLWDFLDTLGKSDIAQDGSYPSLWADAICINQEDVGERNQQVSIMGLVFKYAEVVIVWLGPFDHHLDEFVKLGQSVQELYGTGDDPMSMNTSVRMGSVSVGQEKSIFEVLQRPYWRRLWIVQEITLAYRLVILTNQQVLQWSDFRAISFLRSATDNGRPPQNDRLNQIPGLTILKWRGSDFRCSGATERSIEDLVESFKHQECLDVRDKLFGLLGMAVGGARFPIDYRDSRTAILFKALDRFSTTFPAVSLAHMVKGLLAIDTEAYRMESRHPEIKPQYLDTLKLKVLSMDDFWTRVFDIDNRWAEGSILKQLCVCICDSCKTASHRLDLRVFMPSNAGEDICVFHLEGLFSTYMICNRDTDGLPRMPPICFAEKIVLQTIESHVLLYNAPENMELIHVPGSQDLQATWPAVTRYAALCSSVEPQGGMFGHPHDTSSMISLSDAPYKLDSYAHDCHGVAFLTGTLAYQRGPTHRFGRSWKKHWSINSQADSRLPPGTHPLCCWSRLTSSGGSWIACVYDGNMCPVCQHESGLGTTCCWYRWHYGEQGLCRFRGPMCHVCDTEHGRLLDVHVPGCSAEDYGPKKKNSDKSSPQCCRQRNVHGKFGLRDFQQEDLCHQCQHRLLTPISRVAEVAFQRTTSTGADWA